MWWKFASPSCVRFISFGFLLATTCFYCFSGVPACMAINGSVQYNGVLLPDIILLTQCYFHRGTPLNAMERFRIYSL